jgi:hypothetical protein
MGRKQKKIKNYNKISQRQDSILERRLDEDDKLLDVEENKALLAQDDDTMDDTMDDMDEQTKEKSSYTSNTSPKTSADMSNILSEELKEELKGADILLPSARPKKNNTDSKVELTQDEIRAAKKEKKRLKRKVRRGLANRISKQD